MNRLALALLLTLIPGCRRSHENTCDRLRADYERLCRAAAACKSDDECVPRPTLYPAVRDGKMGKPQGGCIGASRPGAAPAIEALVNDFERQGCGTVLREPVCGNKPARAACIEGECHMQSVSGW
jgi:hypothetical protein